MFDNENCLITSMSQLCKKKSWVSHVIEWKYCICVTDRNVKIAEWGFP